MKTKNLLHSLDFHPQLFKCLRNYSRNKFAGDLSAGMVTGVVALPLAIAFAIASGVSPAVGLLTAIIGGFLVSAFGGNSVQIGGPTGAFIVIVYGIIATHGLGGLALATFMAGIILILLGVFRLGTVIKFIPYPIVVGFTAGIALTILTTQVNDLLGLGLSDLPGEFLPKWQVYLSNLGSTNFLAFGLALVTIAIVFGLPKVSKKLPAALISIIIVSLLAVALSAINPDLAVETVGDRFGDLSPAIGGVQHFDFSMSAVNALLPSAFTIAVLGAIESLLSATVADGVTGSRTNCNTELIGQGIANTVVPVLGGIPVTGAIARTMTNISSGGRTPVAGIIHAVVLLVIFLFAMPLINYVPMACLAGVLATVAYNMSGWRTIAAMRHNPKSDISVMAVTFLLTVIFDLTIAIEMGLLLAVVLFLRRVMENTSVRVYGQQLDAAEGTDASVHEVLDVAPGVEVYEIDGPFFFGVATKFDELMRHNLGETPQVRIIRMRKVPFIDSTGLHNLEILIRSSHAEGIRVVLSGVRDTVRQTLEHSGVAALIEPGHICDHISKAVRVANDIVLTDSEITAVATRR